MILTILKSDKTGLVSLTCDAWQADNVDAYFAVTGHWVEEVSKDVWVEQTALLGFTQLNSSHDGARLGRALFKIVKRLGFPHKVCRDSSTMGFKFLLTFLSPRWGG